MTKRYQRLSRPEMAEEKWLRELFADVIENNTWLGAHKVLGPARKIHLERVMDAVYLQEQEDRKLEKAGLLWNEPDPMSKP
jgi:hypothetical protein